MKRPVIGLILLVVLGHTAPALGADVTVVTAYPANKGPGWKQTIDVAGAVGHRYADFAAINLSHYSTTCIDPSNPELLWTYQAYGNSTVDKQWCTAWAAFTLSSSPAKPKGSTPEIGR
jgi:hypothetical protein